MPKGKSYGNQSGVDRKAAPFGGGRKGSTSMGGRATNTSNTSGPGAAGGSYGRLANATAGNTSGAKRKGGY